MLLDRRQFVVGVAGTGLAYVLGGCSGSSENAAAGGGAAAVPRPDYPETDFREWLHISEAGEVSVFTSRTELGQGITTILYDLICQGMELPRSRVNVVLGDTDSCPNDGSTSGSASTRHVAWDFWRACQEIRRDLVHLAAERLGVSPEALDYEDGEIVGSEDREPRLAIGKLAKEGRVRRVVMGDGADRQIPERFRKTYRDEETLNVNGEAIVTGTLRYTGDLYPEGCLYGGMLLPPTHRHKSRLKKYDVEAAQSSPGISVVQEKLRTICAVGDSFTAVQKALESVEANWRPPKRPRELDPEAEIRAGAELVRVIEEEGRLEQGLEASDQIVEESYITQFATPVPMETESAIADATGKVATVHLGTQSPFDVRYSTARSLEIPEERVHVVSLPAGGAFGDKLAHRVGGQAAALSTLAGAPVKLVYTRAQQFQLRSRYKEAVLVDLRTGVTRDGRMLAQKIDIHQDEGQGTTEVYAIPNVEAKHFHAPMPFRHGTMRGTSFTQDVWALESHVDTVAHAIGMDPVELRRKNVRHQAFVPLLDRCVEMMAGGNSNGVEGRGVGYAICNHGDTQLGAVAADVRVDLESGRIHVDRLCGAFDIGIVINRNTTEMGVRGAMIWGLGYALFEEVELDGHRAYVKSMADYRIARFSDVPPIEIDFLKNYTENSPQGCGELPLVPTIPAICNAVYNATGVRFHTLPMTPARMKEALAHS